MGYEAVLRNTGLRTVVSRRLFGTPANRRAWSRVEPGRTWRGLKPSGVAAPQGPCLVLQSNKLCLIRTLCLEQSLEGNLIWPDDTALNAKLNYCASGPNPIPSIQRLVPVTAGQTEERNAEPSS